jgi:hypothetical protein
MDITLRFRHPQGTDIGPFALPEALTVEELKERLLLEWPKGECSLVYCVLVRDFRP